LTLSVVFASILQLGVEVGVWGASEAGGLAKLKCAT